MLYGINAGKKSFDVVDISEFTNLETLSDIDFILNLRNSDTIELLTQDAKKYINKRYVGCNEYFSKVLLDKFLTKDVFTHMGFDTTKGVLVKGNYEEIKSKIEKINCGFPLILKELNNTGGQGIYVVNNLYDLQNIELNINKDYILEEFVYGDEYSCNLFVLGNNVTIFPIVKKGHTGIKNNEIIHSLEKIRTTIIDKEIDTKIREIGFKIGSLEGINGFIEIEFILDEIDSRIKIIEINPRISGTTELSLKSSNFSYDDLFETLRNNTPDNSNNVLATKILLEYPIVFDNPDFEKLDLEVEGGKVINTFFCRRFPPFLQRNLIEFESIDFYLIFLKQYEN